MAQAAQAAQAGTGQPAPGIEIILFDDDGNEVTGTGPDHPGEVFVRSAGTFDTYYKNDASYQSNSRGDLHTVGDIAYWDDEATSTSATARAT